MTKQQFDFIIDLIKDHPVFVRHGKKPQRDVVIQLKVALHRLAHDGSLSSLTAISTLTPLGVRFDLHASRLDMKGSKERLVKENGKPLKLP